MPAYTYMCALILPYMCPHTTIHVYAHSYTCVLLLLGMRPSMTMYVSSSYSICVVILLYICPHPNTWQVGVANVVVDTAAFEHFGDTPLTALEACSFFLKKNRPLSQASLGIRLVCRAPLTCVSALQEQVKAAKAPATHPYSMQACTNI